MNNFYNEIKEYNVLIIGFCAGAINLSKYSIITSDNDFKEPFSYKGINRIDLIVEPHFNLSNVNESILKELFDFSIKYNKEILAIQDESIIIVEDDLLIEEGKIYHINKNLIY